jgi:hypothetical protein
MDDPIQDTQRAQALVTWTDDKTKAQALETLAETLDHYDGVQKASGYRQSFLDIEPNRSVRTSFSREDYNRFRSGESVPARQKEAIGLCMSAYDKVGIIRNVIDLMGDFGSQGINLVHPNKRIEKFYRRWFERIHGKERSERFLNTLYRCGNVIVKRRNAKINKKLETELRASGADITPESVPFVKREIPWKYDFLNPLSVEVLGRELAMFVGKPQYVLKISNLMKGYLSGGISGQSRYKGLVNQLPSDLLEAIKNGQTTIPLDPDKISVFHYKKDDWLVWASPLIYAILDDIIMLEKMKLADISALDGAISNIRLWSIGDLEHKILPTKAAINKLRNILSSNVGGGTMDLVWGPELKFTESNSQVYRFLGSEKYEPVLTNIYAGLGIPPTLTGMASTGGGFTNNFISLKTLVERLEYGRGVLSDFWNQEIEIVQKAMGFRLPARVHFDQMTLSDEASEKNLLIQLADRDIISYETLQERFGEIPEIEKIRMKREARERKMEAVPQKAGPYHNPQHRNDLEKIALQKDLVGAEDLGLVPCDETGNHPFSNPDDRRSDDLIEEKKDEIKDKQEDRDQKKFDRQQEKKEQDPNFQQEQEQFAPKGRPEDGRPKNAKDKEKRKQKKVTPRVAADSDHINLMLWATQTQNKIAEITHPPLLAHYGKKNLRGLTKAQMEELEYIKLSLLCSIQPYATVDAELVNDILKQNLEADASVLTVLKQFNSDFVATNDRSPTIDETRYMHISAYALYCRS